ncbi:aminotransferase class I/II-fold pyridoxal phosphate-dependent enzyme [bacterium]|nr:aminotransferase class I/II-fold pyridoxal phosphate-dependent enzyme [bacterium]
MLPSLEQMIVSADAVLVDALKVITKNAQGICFVTEDKKLVGVLADGDIRRKLLAGFSLDTPIRESMKKEYVSLPVNTPNEEIQKRLSNTIHHIPLVDENNRIVDYSCKYRYRRLPIMEPLLMGNELAYVTDCINSSWISSQGSYVKKFESMFTDLFGVQEVLATCNGTTALHLALEAFGIGKEDEVIVPDFTFAASVNSIIYTGATPVIVDVTPDTWTLDPEAVIDAITPRTKAIMPVHIYGHPCDMDVLAEIAHKHDLLVITDAAEAIGSMYKGKPVAAYGDAVIFSFFGNKTITTGEGGVVVFNDPQVADKARILRDHGMSKEIKYWHDYIGFNYRMTNLQAAIGVAQMERFEQIIEQKRRIAADYIQHLSQFSQLTMPPEASWATNSYWLFTTLYSELEGISRDTLIEMLLKNGIETRPTFFPIHKMPPYTGYCQKKEFPNAEKISKQGISFPSSTNITYDQIEGIARVLSSIFWVRNMANGNKFTKPI